MSKICIVVPTFLAGGMERAMSELCNYFARIGNEVHVVFLVKHQKFYNIEDSIILHDPPFGYRNRLISKLLFRFKMIIYQRKLLKRIKPDTVFSVPQGYSDLTIIAGLGTNIPIYISVRNNPKKSISAIRMILRKVLYPLSNGIVAQTEIARETLFRYNRNIKVIHNSVKEMTYYPKNVNKKVILNIGRLEAGKNQIGLIKAFAGIASPDWELWLVGDGPMKEELEHFILSLGLSNQVLLKGKIKNVDEVMGQADIFAFSSLSEGFPNSLLEAKAYPLPCIAFDCTAGPSDIITDNVDGYLVPMGEDYEYAVKLKSLMEDESLRTKFKEGGTVTRYNHKIETVGEEYLRFLLPKLYS